MKRVIFLLMLFIILSFGICFGQSQKERLELRGSVKEVAEYSEVYRGEDRSEVLAKQNRQYFFSENGLLKMDVAANCEVYYDEKERDIKKDFKSFIIETVYDDEGHTFQAFHNGELDKYGTLDKAGRPLETYTRILTKDSNFRLNMLAKYDDRGNQIYLDFWFGLNGDASSHNRSEYDKNNRKTMSVRFFDGDEKAKTQTYHRYNENQFLEKKMAKNEKDEMVFAKYDSEFKYEEIDSQGNWLKRISIDHNENKIKITTRKIQYH